MKLSKSLAAASVTAPDGYDRTFLMLSARRAARLEQEGPQADVRAFREKFDQPNARFPHWPLEAFPEVTLEEDPICIQMRLFEEEVVELREAVRERNLSAVAGECVDVIYVVLGLMLLLGLPFLPFWNLIHRANMAKIPAPNGGKALKPEGWVKPNLQAELIFLTDKALD
jgi:NTP pyrophosphatase (non-canonical NTP hydrolase)